MLKESICRAFRTGKWIKVADFSGKRIAVNIAKRVRIAGIGMVNKKFLFVGKAVKIGVAKIWIGIVDEKFIFNGQSVAVKVASGGVGRIEAAES